LGRIVNIMRAFRELLRLDDVELQVARLCVVDALRACHRVDSFGDSGWVITLRGRANEYGDRAAKEFE